VIITTNTGLPLHLCTPYFTDEVKGIESLTLAERSVTKSFSKKRLADFCTGRHCAREALKKINITGQDILIGTGREPLWPKGITGAISHCSALTGAVVSTTDKLEAFGLDIEIFGGVKRDMWPMLFTEAEIRFLDTVKGDGSLYPTLLFSMKESFYKMQYPLTKTFLEFQDVEITHDNDQFHLSVVTPSASRNLLPKVIEMKHSIVNDLVITYCYLEPN
jgi:4'-phosphopantetheinyl transferase EntD